MQKKPSLSIWYYKEELSVINGIMFKGERIVIPKKMKTDILKKLHQSHMGIEKPKVRARETVFWPGIKTNGRYGRPCLCQISRHFDTIK